jgi:fermentation-respiration switch protein FrsA (DUF1100 family)
MSGSADGSDLADTTSLGSKETDRPVRSGWRTRARRLVVIVLLTYVGVCVIVRFLQSHLIYFPARDYYATPSDVGLEFEDLTLRTEDGLALGAWHIPHPAPKGSLIFCHGNAGNMSDRLHSIKLLHDMGLNVLIFDYRGFGRSEGRPSEQGTYDDVVAAWKYVVETQGVSPDRIVLFGRSLGGAVAIELADRIQSGAVQFQTGHDRREASSDTPQPGGPLGQVPRALVVESTFTNLEDIGRLHYPLLPVRWLLTYRYDSITKVPRITCPKLFMHGTEDTLIPLKYGRKLFDAAADPKQFLETPGGHNEAGFTYAPEFAGRLEAFLDELP